MPTAMEEFKETFKAAKWVSTPLIVVRTADPASTTHLIGRELFDPEEQYPMLHWDLVQGFKSLNDAGKSTAQKLLAEEPGHYSSGPKDAREALTKLQSLAHQKELPAATIAFLANAHRYMSYADATQAIYNLRDILPAENLTLVMLTIPGARVPAELGEHILVLDEPL